MTPKARSAIGYAGGKVILLGEHAVVHGTNALALGLSRGVRVTAREAPGALSLDISDGNLSCAADDGSPEGRAIAALALAIGIEPRGVALEAKIGLPTRAGLGSSAALASAAARALASFHQIEPSPDQLFEAVQASERVFHGNPSGLDARVVLEGGVVLFSRADGARPIAASVPSLLVVHSGEDGETHAMVARFAARLNESGDEGRSRLARIATLVDVGAQALERRDFVTLGQVMNENHELLGWFGMSTRRLDRIVTIAREAGALGAKMTGGGGGGCAVILIPPGDTSIARWLAAAGYESVDV